MLISGKISYLDEVFYMYPVLKELINGTIDRTLQLLNECFLHLTKDIEQIRYEFGERYHKIENIKISSGDTHNGGKRVIIIEFESGKLVYKPPGIEELGYLKEIGNLSLFTGIGSMIYLYYTFYILYDSMNYKEKLMQLIDRVVEEMDGEKLDGKKLEDDIILGVSGTIIVLCEIHSELKDNKIAECIQKMGEVLYAHLSQENESHLTGFSHGYSGYAVALNVIGKLTKDIKYTNLAEHLLEIENRYFDEERMNWKDLREEGSFSSYWCHGSGGIALARTLILDMQQKNKYTQEINAGILDLKNNGFLRDEKYNHSLCHGTFGNIDILLKIAEKNEDNELEAFAKSKAVEELKYIREVGFLAGTKNIIDNNSFMLGLSGIGYELLRIHDRRVPSILSLEVIKN